MACVYPAGIMLQQMTGHDNSRQATTAYPLSISN